MTTGNIIWECLGVKGAYQNKVYYEVYVNELKGKGKDCIIDVLQGSKGFKGSHVRGFQGSFRIVI